MVVNIDSSRLNDDRPAGRARSLRRKAPWQRPERASECVTIGLLNNMAGAAFRATERQFVSLLDSASEGIPIHVSFYTLPGLSRTEAGGYHFASHYQSIDALWDTHLDGLIVTGREPRMADLRDEHYWESFTEVLEWAQTHTYSTVWSCLAAHAAILHMDGIGRRKSEEKNFGVFECDRVSEHPMMQGLPPRFQVPHSRWNGVPHKDLIDHGYTILSQITGNGVDAFVKQEESLFVFFQGHLEYESDTLMREYRRDVGRYVKGETNTHPLLPSGYIAHNHEQALAVLREKAVSCRTTELLASVTTALKDVRIENAWRHSAVRIYRNWLRCISAQKNEDKGKHRSAVLSMSR
jgi:homoserine O-succinyltransferase/O-acetyltransferase